MAARSRREPGGGSSPYLSQAIADAMREASEKRLLAQVRSAPVPRHLAIIMDGNRRFAAEHQIEVD
ncbi:MAG: hypothetical protein WCA77_07825, partial [Thermoplasmata archaeon]